ncbi:MAG: hypothetical protein NT099_01265 [Candidatus Saganbacteria bacterium]|nr:hypothetical protein [Candidatus Saganbacteria bacterium]
MAGDCLISLFGKCLVKAPVPQGVKAVVDQPAAPPAGGAGNTTPSQLYPLNRWFKDAYVDGNKKALPKDEKKAEGPRVRVVTSGVAVEGVVANKEITLVFKVPEGQKKAFNTTGLQVEAVIPTVSDQVVIGLAYKLVPAGQVEVGQIEYNPTSGELKVKVTVKVNPGAPIVLRLGGTPFATLKFDAPKAAPAAAAAKPAEGAGSPAGGPKPKPVVRKPVVATKPLPSAGGTFGSGKD